MRLLREPSYSITHPPFSVFADPPLHGFYMVFLNTLRVSRGYVLKFPRWIHRPRLLK